MCDLTQPESPVVVINEPQIHCAAAARSLAVVYGAGNGTRADLKYLDVQSKSKRPHEVSVIETKKNKCQWVSFSSPSKGIQL